jgi:hypothetical protein
LTAKVGIIPQTTKKNRENHLLLTSIIQEGIDLGDDPGAQKGQVPLRPDSQPISKNLANVCVFPKLFVFLRHDFETRAYCTKFQTHYELQI